MSDGLSVIQMDSTCLHRKYFHFISHDIYNNFFFKLPEQHFQNLFSHRTPLGLKYADKTLSRS